VPRTDDTVTAVELVDPLIGTIFDKRFRVEERLAAGGFGAIYRATHIKSGHQVALKLLHPTLASDLGVLARFRREGTTLTSLRNPHTITAYEFGQSDKTLFIVMELLHGDSVYARFEKGRRAESRQVARIATQVCESLEEAHAQGIVHRDLKPTNIHLEEVDGDPDYVKVLDFGIAKILMGSEHDASDITNAGQMIGTLDYMSPEQMVGGQVTGQTDIYTLGILMYEMIAGTRPFPESQTASAALAAMLKTVPTPLSQRVPVPRELEAVVMRCLEKETSKRYRTVGEVRSALLAIIGEPVSQTATIAVPRLDEEPESEGDATTVTPPQDAERLLRAAKIDVETTTPRQQAISAPSLTPPLTPQGARPGGGGSWDVDETAPTTTRLPDGVQSAIPPTPMRPPLRPLESRNVKTPVPQIVVAPFSTSRPSAPTKPSHLVPHPMLPQAQSPHGQPPAMQPPYGPSPHGQPPHAPSMQGPYGPSPHGQPPHAPPAYGHSASMPPPHGPPPQAYPPPAGFLPQAPPSLQGFPQLPMAPTAPPYPMMQPGASPSQPNRAPTGYDMSGMAARDAMIRRVVWIAVLVLAALAGFVLATRL